jgi:soluble lytic murein transglycosylase-like protein
LLPLRDTPEKAKGSLLVLDEQNENNPDTQNLVMKIIKLMLLSFAFISQVTVFASYAPYVSVEEGKSIPKTSQNAPGSFKTVGADYSELIEKYSLKWQVSPTLTASIISCESGNNPMAHALTEKEDSWGLVQINLKAHLHITKAQATNPEFAINFLTENIAKGNAPQMWYTCYKKATLVR